MPAAALLRRARSTRLAMWHAQAAALTAAARVPAAGPWANNCIGHANYHSFFLMLVCEYAMQCQHCVILHAVKLLQHAVHTLVSAILMHLAPCPSCRLQHRADAHVRPAAGAWLAHAAQLSRRQGRSVRARLQLQQLPPDGSEMHHSGCSCVCISTQHGCARAGWGRKPWRTRWTVPTATRTCYYTLACKCGAVLAAMRMHACMQCMQPRTGQPRQGPACTHTCTR